MFVLPASTPLLVVPLRASTAHQEVHVRRRRRFLYSATTVNTHWAMLLYAQIVLRAKRAPRPRQVHQPLAMWVRIRLAGSRCALFALLAKRVLWSRQVPLPHAYQAHTQLGGSLRVHLVQLVICALRSRPMHRHRVLQARIRLARSRRVQCAQQGTHVLGLPQMPAL